MWLWYQGRTLFANIATECAEQMEHISGQNSLVAQSDYNKLLTAGMNDSERTHKGSVSNKVPSDHGNGHQ